MQVKLLAEPWDCGGLYQVGSFPNWDVWGEWNGRFRDDVRWALLSHVAAHSMGACRRGQHTAQAVDVDPASSCWSICAGALMQDSVHSHTWTSDVHWPAGASSREMLAPKQPLPHGWPARQTCTA